MRLSKPAAERLSKTVVTLLLVIGAIPIALPLVWLVLSSLKSEDRVLTESPEWLPWAEVCTVADGGRDVPVTVVDDSRGDVLGWWRIKPVAPDDHTLFHWPASEVTATQQTGYVARIGWIKRAVSTPQPAEEPGQVRVGQLGTQRIVSVSPGTLKRVSRTQQVAELLGQPVPIAVETEGTATTLRVVEPGPPVLIADTRIGGEDGAHHVSVESLGGVRLPVEIVEHIAGAGLSRVRLVPGPALPVAALPVPVESRTVEHWVWHSDGREVEVKPTRRDAHGRPIEVAVVGQLKDWVVPATDVTAVTRTEYRIRWLGQTLTVQPVPDAEAPPGQWALRLVAPHDSVVVAAARVRQQRHLAPRWSNYVDVFRVEPLHKYVLNTLFITALSILGNVLSCGLVGYAFARLPFRGKNVLFLVLLSTMMLPATITFLPTYILYVKIGWLDTYYPMIVPTFLATAAFFVFLYRQYFMTIPLDLEDAARIDGCGPLATFWHIMLPLARPAVVTVAVFTFMGAWNDFMNPLLYLNTDEYQTLAYGLYSFKSGLGYKYPNYMMAASTMMMIPTLLIFFAAQNAFLRGVVVTGVKG